MFFEAGNLLSAVSLVPFHSTKGCRFHQGWGFITAGKKLA